MGAYDRVYWHGRLFNKRTVSMLKRVEKACGYLTIYQGSYSGSVGASAGTHDGGGAVDLWGNDPDKIVRVMRQVGFAAWKRSPSQGPWIYHIHGIAIGDRDLSSGARAQVAEYYQGYDGLAGSGRDYHWRPSPIPIFKYGQGVKKVKKVWDYGVIKRQFRLRNPRPKDAVKVLQRELEKAGYEVGPIDGVAGPRTKAAFRRYRKDRGPFRAMRTLFSPYKLRRKNK